MGYVLGPDSIRQTGVPVGDVEKRRLDESSVYPGTAHDYWLYVPKQYRDDQPACIMFFQDGEMYVHEQGSVQAPIAFDNLIDRGEIPVTIGVFVNPASVNEIFDRRGTEYQPMNGTYARFLLEDMEREVGYTVNLAGDANSRGICGMSDGGLCSFTAVWHRPDAFSKAISHVGSFTRLRGGSEYPFHIRNTRGKPKPIRVFLQDGENDVNLMEGNWTLANQMMASALAYARYDHRFELGTGGHDLQHGGAIFPESLRWLWRDHPQRQADFAVLGSLRRSMVSGN